MTSPEPEEPRFDTRPTATSVPTEHLTDTKPLGLTSIDGDGGSPHLNSNAHALGHSTDGSPECRISVPEPPLLGQLNLWGRCPVDPWGDVEPSLDEAGANFYSVFDWLGGHLGVLAILADLSYLGAALSR